MLIKDMKATGLFDLFDIEIETLDSMPDLDDLSKGMKASLVSVTYNTVFFGLLTDCLQTGWGDVDLDLGQYIKKLAKLYEDMCDLTGKSTEGTVTTKSITDNENAVELLDKYGAAYKKNKKIPVLVFKDKKTGKPIGEDVDKIFGAGVLASELLTDLMKGLHA